MPTTLTSPGVNATLRALNLESNCIGSRGISALATALAKNSSLRELRLCNQMGASCSLSVELDLARALETNSTLTTLSFDWRSKQVRPPNLWKCPTWAGRGWRLLTLFLHSLIHSQARDIAERALIRNRDSSHLSRLSRQSSLLDSASDKGSLRDPAASGRELSTRVSAVLSDPAASGRDSARSESRERRAHAPAPAAVDSAGADGDRSHNEDVTRGGRSVGLGDTGVAPPAAR